MASEDEDNAEGGANAEGAADEGKKKGGLKKLLIILVPILLLVGGGAGAYFMGYLDSLLGVEKPAEEGEHGEAAEGEHGEGEKKSEGHGEKKAEGDHGAKPAEGGHGEGGGDNSAFLAIPTMIVNLNSEDGTPRYLRLTVQLELEDPSQKAEVEVEIPRVIDQFQTYLRELRVQDLRGSAGIYRLQVELLWRVNQAVHPIEIKDVLFQEILIQ
jgi:flagellar protein FliL